MYLFQKLKYNYKHLDISDYEEFTAGIDEFISNMVKESPDYVCFDTETDGLDIMTAKPFLIAIGYNKTVITFDYDPTYASEVLEKLKDSGIFTKESSLGLGAHNCKFDYHMLLNGGSPIPEEIPLFDSITVARLTEYADIRDSVSLEAIGTRYVDDTAKFAGGVIKTLINRLNKEKRDYLRNAIMDSFPDDDLFTITKSEKRRGTAKLTQLIDNYNGNRTQFLNDDDVYFKFIDEHFKPANYQDVYEREPELMRSYAADDIVIMIEYLNKAVKPLRIVDKDLRVLKREGRLIVIAADMEKVGLKVDIDYMLSCRQNIVEYRELLYLELLIMTGLEFSVGQHEFIKRILLTQFQVKTDKCDEKALKYIRNNGKGEVVDFVNNILELRTIDKWLSTYIDGKLNQVVNGRIHTNMNNNGAISGRISCDMQQQPRNALEDREGNELFHPRKMFIVDEGTKLFFIDESQMELRVQANYTVLTASEPDVNLCRAYIPYKCHTKYKDDMGNLTVLPFNIKDKKHLDVIDDYTWYLNEDESVEWTPTDLHCATASHAFPDFKNLDPEKDAKLYKQYRSQGKTTNFLKVYQGGVIALMETLDCSRELAETLDQAFYKSFPRIREYQEWVNKQASLYGYVENLYGRRYYMNSSQWYYKLCNYLIQGTCADMVKEFEIKIYDFLRENGYKTKMVLPVHDEIIFIVPDGEEHIVKEIKSIMEDTRDVIEYIPMVAEMEYSTTNWREKEEWKDV